MISVVIPVLNEARALPLTLRSIALQTCVYELIVVDGGSTDGTIAVTTAWAGKTGLGDRLRAIASARGRAAQMNAGAEIATGEWLLFLHADTQLPVGALDAIARLGAQHEFGGFHHQFDVDDWRLRFVSMLHNFRCAWTGVFYGDQAMFVRRSAFFDVGGFPATCFLEDVMLSERFLQRAPPVFLELAVVTGSRKFVAAGIWLSLYRCLAIIVAYRWGRRDAYVKPAARFFEDVR